MLKYLRIAVTALCLTACVLLIALWVRSYRVPDGFVRFGIAWSSQDGALSLVYPADFAADPNEQDSVVTYMLPYTEPVPVDWTVDSYGFRFVGSWSMWIVVISYAYPVVLFGALAFAPWLRLRFSLRTLLIATTVVALSQAGFFVRGAVYYGSFAHFSAVASGVGHTADMPNNTLKSIYQKQAVIKSYARSIEFYRQQPETYEPNLTWQLYSRINRENAAELVRLTPPDILAKIRIEVDRAPRTQEEWDGTLYFGSSTSRAGGSDAKDTYRQAVELLRELFARQAPTFQNPTH